MRTWSYEKNLAFLRATYDLFFSLLKGIMSHRHKGTGFVLSCVMALFLGGLLANIYSQTIPRFRIKEVEAREHFKKGLNFFNRGQYVASREFFYKALDVQPYFHLARRYLGDSYYYAGDWNGALEHWDFLDEISDGAYPLIKERGNLLRYYLSKYSQLSSYTYYTSYTPESWPSYAFDRPVDAELDEDGILFLTSYKSGNVVLVNPGGQAIDSFRGRIYSRLEGPSALSLFQEKVYVADFSADQIRVFEKHGAPILSFGDTGSGAGQFRGPSGIAVGPSGIYVADTGNRRVQKFDLNGNFLTSFGGIDEERKLQKPIAVAIDTNGQVYVLDKGNSSLLIYDTDGNYLEDIYSELFVSPHSVQITKDHILVADEGAGILLFDLRERTWRKIENLRDSNDMPVQFVRPSSAKMGPQGEIVVTDYGANRVILLTPGNLRLANLDTKIERVDTSSFPSVAVFLTIQDRLGHPIRSLTRQEIFVFENDRRVRGVRTDNMNVFNQRTNINIVKENSTHFEKSGLNEYAKAGLQEAIAPLKIVDRLRIVRVGETVRSVYEGLERREAMKQMVSGENTENPNLGKGLYEGLSLLTGDLGSRAIVLIVSGRFYEEAFDQYSLSRVVSYSMAHSIPIHVVSFEADDNATHKEEAKRIYMGLADQTGGKYWNGYKESELRELYPTIRNHPDDRYILTFKSSFNRGMQGRYIDIRTDVRYHGTVGVADGGYFVP